MSDSEEDIFLTQSSFNGSINSGNNLENLLGDYENAQFSIEEADKYEEVSIGSVDKEAETNEKKTSKRDIIVVGDKELLARNSERIPKNTKKVTFGCLNVVLFVSACNAMRVGVHARGILLLIFP